MPENKLPSPGWYLQGFDLNNQNQLRVALTTLPFTVGRTLDCELPLDSLRISQKHAEFFRQKNQLCIRDCNSTNGTFLNGERLYSDQQLITGDVIHFADIEFRIVQHEMNSTNTIYAETLPINKDDLDRGKYREFREMLSAKNVSTLFQPIANLYNQNIIGHEALGQGILESDTVAVTELFVMAETLGLAKELSGIFRERSFYDANDIDPSTLLFINTHPAELADVDALAHSLQTLQQQHADRPIVLEIHESAVTDVKSLQSLRRRLAELNIKIAFDDFGVGQARLVELSDAAPDYLKFDYHLIHNLHRASKKRRDVLSALVKITKSMDIIPIAEGIEQAPELFACQDVGFEFGQGYFLGKPKKINEN